jgi:PAS domain S-box-containing protein
VLAAHLGPERAARLGTVKRPAILFAASGEVLWQNAGVAPLLRLNPAEALTFAPSTPGLARIRGFAKAAAPGDWLGEALRLFVGGRLESLKAESLALQLADGTPAVLTLFGSGERPEIAALPPPKPKPVAAPVAAPHADAGEVFVPPVPRRPARAARFILLTDAAGNILSLSPAFQHLTGSNPAEFIGQPLADILADIDPASGARIARALHARQGFDDVAVDWPGEDGEITSLVLSGTPVIENGAFAGFNGLGTLRRAAGDAGRSLPAATPDAETALALTERLAAPVEPETATVDAVAEADEADSAITAAPPATPAAKPLQPEPPATDPAKQDNAPLHSLAGSVDASLGAAKVVPLKPVRTLSGAVQGLSHSERHAFREIARALGARFDGEDHADTDTAAKGTTAPVPSTPASPAPSAPVKAAETAPAASEAGSNHVAAAQAEISRALAAQAASEKPRPALTDILVERVPIGLLVFRGDKPLYLNRTLLDMLGYQDLAEFDALRGLEKLFRGRAAPSFSNGEYDTITIMGRDGQTLPADAHLQAIDWNGQHATMVSFRRALDAEMGPRARSLDLELKARSAELAETRAMLDTATDGVISLDENGRILALNKSAEALFGYDQNELAGERLTLLLAPESHAAALDYIDGLKTGGVASVLNDGREVIGKERNGGRLPLFMTIGRISETSKFAAVVRDLTAWKRAEAELTDAKRAAERSSALKSDFLAKVSHEIRTPMNAIIGFAEVMRDERLGPIGTERYKDYLKDIHTSGEHVISLVNDLLDLSKIEAGRLELSFGSVDLNAIVTSCLGIMQPQANRDRVIMRSQLSSKLPPVVADERSIRQIVLNLLSNASKFTEPGGQVIISTALTEAGEAVIRVRDTGVGMTEQDIQAAMEPFRQLSNARGRGGTGLGLPLTKALVEANRASFLIRSKVREGTLVEVIFPPTRVLAE